MNIDVAENSLIIPPNYKIFDIMQDGWESGDHILYVFLPEDYDLDKLLLEFKKELNEPVFNLTRKYKCWDIWHGSTAYNTEFPCQENEVNPSCTHCSGKGILEFDDETRFSHGYPKEWNEMCRTYKKWEEDCIDKWNLKEEETQHESESESEVEVYMKGERLIRIFQPKHKIFRKWLETIHPEIRIIDNLIKEKLVSMEETYFQDISYKYHLEREQN